MMNLAVTSRGVEWISAREKDAQSLVWSARMQQHELVTYEGSGEGVWWIIDREDRIVATGMHERDARCAKLRAEAVYVALTANLYRAPR